MRYIGIDTPERGDICYDRAKTANARLVDGQTVKLDRDVSDTDFYGRLLRYVYVDGRFVNEALVSAGFAENSVWEPDTRFAGRFRALERQARAANRGCHRSGAFADGDPNR
ncbi:MAG: thermonuclease family protein [Chloroflexi bacterium]|nr:thermonuclease family protein [Chloroflexota bacterium]